VQARAEHKPILLDVGAAWCHWCHVMDRESYEDPDLAAYLNAHFVCVKVDRDERPDVDARYQRAVQALTGQGGWPLTAFLTPDGDVFYGGTYFPPDDRFGRQSFRAVLERVRDIFARRADQVAASGREVRAHVAKLLREEAPGAPSPDLLARGTEEMARMFDERHGGFGHAPKFPHPAAVEFLLARWWDRGEARLREIVEKTLAGMANGGMHDQVGGGFHRYATDERWTVPHFEKMLYDNAELLKVYAHAYAALREPLFREAAEGIVAWSLEVLADVERGGFGASQDADVGLDDDGDYFTWTEDEARSVLDEAEWRAAQRRWDIYPDGEMRHDPGKNVLWVARDVAAVAQELHFPEAEVTRLLASARAKLKAARDRRAAPAVDRAAYVSWNAMMAEAFLDAAAALDLERCRDFALRTLERLWAEASVDGGLLRHRIDQADSPVLLDDQVQAASAALAAFEHTGRTLWLDRARALADALLERFADREGGGFFDRPDAPGAGLLGERATPIQDAPTPAPNAVAALVLLRLACVTEDARYAAQAERVLAAFGGGAAQMGLFAATYLRAVDFRTTGECRIVVADATTSSAHQSLRHVALGTYRPRRVLVPSAASPVAGTPPPVALVCAGTSCAAPASTPADLRRTLESFGRAG
jgi:uncharacterized protein YyaL (SSP411 family)